MTKRRRRLTEARSASAEKRLKQWPRRAKENRLNGLVSRGIEYRAARQSVAMAFGHARASAVATVEQSR